MQKVKQFAIEKKDLCIRAAVVLGTVLALVLTMSLTVFAETTYLINDGERQVVHKTGATEPEEVLEEAGLALCAGDQITTEEGFLTATINIRRAVDVTINYYGEVITAVAYEDETLADILTRLELTWNENDVISRSLDTLAYDGLNLDISTVVVQEETSTLTIPFETEYVNDSSMAKGATKVRTKGQEGEMVRTESVTYVNGKETAREFVSEEITTEAVNKVVAVGTAKNVTYRKTETPVIGNGTITLSTGEVLTYTSSMSVKATAYTHTDAGCNTTTATGTTVRWGTVAVDPRMIPYGTRMFIMTNDGSFVYGIATAEDCGGSIKGNRVDLYMPTYSQCINFGVRNCTIYFLG